MRKNSRGVEWIWAIGTNESRTDVHVSSDLCDVRKRRSGKSGICVVQGDSEYKKLLK